MKLISKDDVRALSILKATTKYNGEFFESGLLWKYDDQLFPESFSMALKRLESVNRKME